MVRELRMIDTGAGDTVPAPSSPEHRCTECNGLGYWIDEATEDYAGECSRCFGTGGNHPAIGIQHPQLRRREDDWCPVCETWPRATIPVADPQLMYTHRLCLTCNQTWEDHHDHTPD